MPNDITIKLLTGAEKQGTLTRSFDPAVERIELYRGDDERPQTLSLAEICFIKFIGKPDLTLSFQEDEFFEDVITITGDEFHVRMRRGEKFDQGFFGYPTEIDVPYKSIFFTRNGIQGRRHDQPLGEVLRRTGLIEEQDIAAALEEQQQLRERRLGEILSTTADVTPVIVEQVIQNARRAESQSGQKQQIKVGEILVEAGLVTREQVKQALNDQTTGKRKRIGMILVDRGLITEDQLLSALAQKFGLKRVDLDEITPDSRALKRISREMIERMQILPIELDDDRLVVATSTPTDPTISENLRFATNAKIELVVAGAGQIQEKISEIFVNAEETVEDLLDEMDDLDVLIDEEPEVEKVTESDSKVINIVNRVLLDAYYKKVSDIHFEPGMGLQPLRIRYRKDGICFTVHQIAATYKAAIISRIKIIAKLDIAEHRRPQSGKILLKSGLERIEYRVEITPTIGGQQDAVLRVLASSQVLPLSELGFSAINLERFKNLLGKPYGIVLCVGPTGSGKTTSLHSAIAEINDNEKKIWTAEDPVEVTQQGLRQVQVHPKIGFNFEDALRSFLRADPDVIMIGEMRDAPTAKTAIGASLTGHLVFSTLHTNSAPETIVRLIEMGIDPYNFSDAMLGILAQRLVRRLCTECKEPYHPERTEYEELVSTYGPEEFKRHEMPGYSKSLTLMKPVGCEACEGLGFRGRMAVHELLVNSPAIRKEIKRNGSVEDLAQVAQMEGMLTLRQDGIHKIFLGLTDLKQIRRISI